MKIVSVMTSPGLGGAEFAAVEMLDAMVARGHEAIVLTDVPGIDRDTGVRAVPIELGPKLSKRSYLELGVSWPMLLRRLKRALEAEAPYDVLLVHYKKEQLLAALLPERLRRVLVWAEWGPVPYPLRSGPARRAYAGAAARAELIMAVSAGTKRSVVEVGVDPAKVEIVHNVVRDDEIDFSAEGRERIRAALGIPAEAFTVGCVSRFHPKKRNDVVVEATLALAGEPHLILAGDGETEDELRRLAEPLGDRVHFIPTPREEIADVLSAFDVSVFCPSPTEGAPRAVILAMLARRACVATGAEGVAEMVDDEIGGITRPENDVPALLAKLEPLAADPERRRRAGELARSRAVEMFSAPVVSAHVETLLLEACRSA